MNVLSGFRVLDFGRYIAGPYCATLLAEFGAEVIRIEKVAGSEDRYHMPVDDSGVGALFLQINRNKKGMTLNPMKAEGREIVAALVATADVVVANLPAKGLAAMGLDYESLRAIKEDIILTTVSAFGDGGPYSDRVGFDGLGQVMSGASYMTGPEGSPTKFTMPIVDYGTAMTSAFGTLAALMHRDKTGQGQVVEGALLNTALTYASAYLMEQKLSAPDRVATHNRSQVAGPADTIPTKDGWILVQVIGQPLFERWAHLVGRPDLLDDPRYASDEDRGRNGEDLSAIARQHAADLTTKEVLALYAQVLVPAGPVYSPQQALDDPHVKAMGFLRDVQYADLPPTPLATAPVSLSQCPREAMTPPPELGQHTDEILEALGYEPTRIAELRAARVV
jgi:crotonobetainyl-CoA:carnitine CoA-transferase CaiB-like acyl-CoA transferase